MQVAELRKKMLAGLRSVKAHMPELIFFGVLYLLLVAYYSQIIRFYGGDFPLHNQMLYGLIREGSFPIPPGYQFLLWVFSGFRNSVRAYIVVSVLLVPLFVILKVKVLQLFFYREFSGFNTVNAFGASILVALMLSLAGPLYLGGQFFYIGRIAMNIWHNPTYMGMIPFSILLFLYTPAFVKNPGKHYKLILLLGLINLLFKPSFLFAWIPGVFLYSLFIMNLKSRSFFMLTGVLFFKGLLIVFMYYMIYLRGSFDAVVYPGMGESALGLDFFRVWRLYLAYTDTTLFRSLFTSFLFPVLFLLFYGRSGRISELHKLSLLMMFFGMMFLLFMVETGPRLTHGNFFWTAHAVSMMWFLSGFRDFISIQSLRRFREPRSWILLVVFAWHVVSGVIYLGHYILNGKYY